MAEKRYVGYQCTECGYWQPAQTPCLRCRAAMEGVELSAFEYCMFFGHQRPVRAPSAQYPQLFVCTRCGSRFKE